VIDHLVYAAPSLERAVADITAEYHVAAVPGGRHPGYGTRNALVGLGKSFYLELVGIDTEQAVPARGRLFSLDESAPPRYVTWCARAPRPLAQTVAVARAAGVDLGEILSMSRTRPDGSVIAWTVTSPFADRAGGVLPFYIDWGAGAHPASALPAQLSLVSLTAIHPDADFVRATLEALGEHDVRVEAGPLPELRVVMR
jgi:Glyoxalase-like domain